MSSDPRDTSPEKEDALGLSIDMLDADRLREWARLLLVHGADITHWSSVPFVASKLQTIATGVEKAVRDIVTLRQGLAEKDAEIAELRAACYEWSAISTRSANREAVLENELATSRVEVTALRAENETLTDKLKAIAVASLPPSSW